MYMKVLPLICFRKRYELRVNILSMFNFFDSFSYFFMMPSKPSDAITDVQCITNLVTPAPTIYSNTFAGTGCNKTISNSSRDVAAQLDKLFEKRSARMNVGYSTNVGILLTFLEIVGQSFGPLTAAH